MVMGGGHVRDQIITYGMQILYGKVVFTCSGLSFCLLHWFVGERLMLHHNFPFYSHGRGTCT